jgi:hypothetical protein
LEHHEELLVETLGFVVLARERLHHAHLGERLLQHTDRLTLRVLRGARDVANAAAEVLADDADRRSDDEREKREPPVHQEDDRDAADEREDLAEDLDDRLGDDAVNERRVARHVRHEIPGLAHVEEGQGHRLQVIHDRHAQIEDDLLPRPRHDELANPIDDGPNEQDGDEDDYQLVKQTRLLQTEVKHPLNDLRPHQSERGRDQEQNDRDPEVPSVRSDESQEPSVHRDRGPLFRGVPALPPHEHVDAAAATRNHHFLKR